MFPESKISPENITAKFQALHETFFSAFATNYESKFTEVSNQVMMAKLSELTFPMRNMKLTFQRIGDLVML